MSSCTGDGNDETASLARAEQYAEIIEVQTTPVIRDNFSRELVSNGRLNAINKATVSFRVQEMITEVNVVNGQRVNQGDPLVSLEQFPFQSRLERTLEQVERTRIDLEDRLLDYGYFMRDSTSIPDHLMQAARIRSGYNSALNDLAEARYELQRTRITAPISGAISELEASPHNHSSTYNKICVIIDNSILEARFPVLESETNMIIEGQSVEITPFANRGLSYTGRVSGFEPTVDDRGMVTVMATVQNPGGELLDGMNVQVFLKREVPDQLIIPREALVMRQGRQVVFTLSDTLALWNYVETGMENSRQYTINSGLTEGQEAIVYGNFNLAHETRVTKAD